MPSRAYTSFLHEPIDVEASEVEEVSMPSRAYTSFLLDVFSLWSECENLCVNALSGLYLISTTVIWFLRKYFLNCVNALSGLYLIST